ncbi:MAG: CDP-alcohol phosphatidyltransferase family protein, partial [Gaiellaceae bacterium]
GQGRLSREALLFATAATQDGGPAAVLGVVGTTVLGRLLSQLASLGVRRAWVVTRPAWRSAVEEAAAAGGLDATVVDSEGVGDDLALTGEIAGQARGPLIIGNAHVLTHREALAGLLADPRILSGALVAGSALKAPWAFAVRLRRARVVSAASPYHRVKGGSGHFLGVMKVDARDRERLVTASRELAELAADRPRSWDAEFERKAGEWRLRGWGAEVERETGIAPDPEDAPKLESIRLDAAAEAELELRRRVAADDPLPLLLVGLVRADVDLFPSNLRQFFYATPVSTEAAQVAVDELGRSDEDRVLLESAVKANDGFFTTYFVSPYSKYLARFAARRRLTPNQISTLSFAIGLAAAASFAVGSRASLIAGAVLLQISFTVDCVDGQLARYTRTFSKLGAWLDSVFDRTKEYVVYAGLALGARGFGEDVWLLAAAALTLQTVRHVSDFAYIATQRHALGSTTTVPLDQPGDQALADAIEARGPQVAAPGAAQPDPTPRERLLRGAIAAVGRLRRSSLLRWGNKIIRMPIGERFALISLTAAIATPRVTFIALLAWGAVAAVYALTVRILVSYALPRRLVRAVLG